MKQEIIKKIKPTLWYLIRFYTNKFLGRIDRKTGTAKDLIDERDYKFSSIGEKLEIKLPKSVFIKNGKIVDQGRTNLCVAYGSAEGCNETLEEYKKEKRTTPTEVADYIRNNLDADIDKEGTYIQYGPKALQKLGKIEEYIRVETLEQVKTCLALGLTIATGSNKIDWRRTGQTNIATSGAGGGHFMNVVGYDDEKQYLIVENTWGEDWGNNGHYYVPYDRFDLIYSSKYALIVDKKDLYSRIEQLKQEKKDKGNRYYYLIEKNIKNGYPLVFQDLFEDKSLTAGEVKTLIELHYIKKNNL